VRPHNPFPVFNPQLHNNGSNYGISHNEFLTIASDISRHGEIHDVNGEKVAVIYYAGEKQTMEEEKDEKPSFKM